MLLLLLLLLALLTPSSCQWLDPSALIPDTGNCYNISIPYPFAITGNYSLSLLKPFNSSFEINCDGSAPMLTLPSRQYEIVNISILEGTITILGRTATWQCVVNNNTNNSISTAPPDLDFSLEGTPFTFSDTRNKFTAVGCDSIAIIRDANGSYLSACASFCVSTNKIDEGVCSGVGCCQAPVPTALKKLHVNFTSIRGQTGVENAPWKTCNKAFLVEENEYIFTLEDLLGNQNNQNRTVVLEWSIGNQSCGEMDKTVCKANSHCYNSTNGIGYRCNCSEGFEGNPYLTPGCKDINECDRPNNPCVHPKRCKNIISSYKCPCPFGMSGDGTLHGTGCKKVAPLELALGMGLFVLLIMFTLVLWTYWLVNKRKLARRKQRYFFRNGGFMLRQRISSQKAPAKIFSSEELEKASNNYSNDRILGKGGYGTVYKGILEDHTVVAIKKSKFVDQTQIEQFINEVVILSQIDHRNVVKLLGCCLETEVPLLVYEFIPKGNLFYHLHNHLHNDRLGSISWENRLRIAVETAAALAHLHSATQFPIIHRDVKSSNILLDENYTAKVSDFGASRLVPYNQTHVTTLVQGTLGYLDPEYFQTSVLTEKSDVYSFGVVLVELLTREMPVSHSPSKDWKNLAAHFTTLVECNQFLDIIDHTVLKEAGVRHLNVFVQIALNCLSLRSENRPKMVDVLVELNALMRLLKQHMIDQTQEEHLGLSPKETMLYEGSSSKLIKIDEDDDNMESRLLV